MELTKLSLPLVELPPGLEFNTPRGVLRITREIMPVTQPKLRINVITLIGRPFGYSPVSIILVDI